MKIAFFGLPLAAWLLHRAGHEIAFAALCRKELPGTRRLRRAIGEAQVRVKPAIDAKLIARVREAAPDLVVSWFWTTKLPLELVRAARLGGVGVHPSLLPRWRGPDPCFWAIDAGDEETGVTAHRLDAEYDSGAMIGARRVRIDPRWNAWTLARALDRLSLALLGEVVERYAHGEHVEEEAQDEAAVTEAPAPTEAMLAIDWKRTAATIARRVRAAAPYPGAWTFIGEEALVITRAEEARAPRGLEPGEAAVVDGRAVVRAADGGVALVEGRIVGDDDSERTVDSAEIAAAVARAS